MKINKKGQAATEFIMTYGWAILVVLAAIGASAYFGVLSPDKFLPERCTFPSGIDCIDKAVIDATADTVSVALKNNIGYAIEVNALPEAIDDCTAASATVNGVDPTATPQTIENNGQLTLVVTCNEDLTPGRFMTDITLIYDNVETGLTHRGTGNIRGRAS